MTYDINGKYICLYRDQNLVCFKVSICENIEIFKIRFMKIGNTLILYYVNYIRIKEF